MNALQKWCSWLLVSNHLTFRAGTIIDQQHPLNYKQINDFELEKSIKNYRKSNDLEFAYFANVEENSWIWNNLDNCKNWIKKL